MLHENSRNKIRVGKPILQLTTSGECHYQFDTGCWIVFDSIDEASEFIQSRLRVEESGETKKKNGGAWAIRTLDHLIKSQMLYQLS